MASLGQKLKELRINSGKTQEDMSKLLNISRVSYTQYENDKRAPSFETIIQLSNIFNVTTDYLLRKSSIGSRLKALRLEKGLSQQEIADALHINRSAYASWENDTNKPLRKLDELSAFFHVSSDYLLCLTDNPTQKREPPEPVDLKKLLKGSQVLYDGATQPMNDAKRKMIAMIIQSELGEKTPDK